MAWNNMLTTLLLGLNLVVGITQAQSTAYNDAKTGIVFQQVIQGDFQFGIALPEKPSTDFVGRISGKGAKGWAGISLGGRMANSLMVVAWPNEKNVVASVRYSSGYANPPPSSNSSISLQTIPTGTSSDGSTYTYTFLCKGCLQTDGSTFKADAENPKLGYGLSSVKVKQPANPAAGLNFHAAGQGLFTVNIGAARSDKFETWAAAAKGAESTTGASASGGSAPAAQAEIVTTVSKSTYDYIVVGSGPAGLIAAQRLTETGRSVLLLERGMASIAASGGKKMVPWSQNLTYYDIPGLFMNMFAATESEGFCTDTAGLSGCLLGGGGSMNGMAFIRPPSWDFDDSWPAGWKAADMIPSAARLYARNPGTTLPSMDGKYYDNEVFGILEDWYKSSGWNYADSIQHPNDKNRSFGPPALNVANGIRSGPLWTYLPLAQTKSNFKLQLKTKVLRVVREGSKITGVEVETAPDRREIINLNPGGGVLLAAGAMSTPRVLFNSGIGRAEQLNIVKSGKTRVKLPDERDWINLPVGYNVKDHSRYQLWFNVTNGFKTYTNAQLMNPPAADVVSYRNRSGVLAQSFMRMDTFRRIKTSDGHEVMFQAHHAAPEEGRIEFTYLLTHGATSVGQLSINAVGNTIFAKEPWTNTDTDREAWSLAVGELLDMTRKPGSRLVYQTGINTTVASVLSTPAQQGVHFAGGTRMGTDDGRNGGQAVVDLNTKVYGTDNLFVVDASFHPDLPTGNTQAIIMVAAEHAVKKIIALRPN